MNRHFSGLLNLLSILGYRDLLPTDGVPDGQIEALLASVPGDATYAQDAVASDDESCTAAYPFFRGVKPPRPPHGLAITNRAVDLSHSLPRTAALSKNALLITGHLQHQDKILSASIGSCQPQIERGRDRRSTGCVRCE